MGLHQEVGRNDTELAHDFLGLLQVESSVCHVGLGLGYLRGRIRIPCLFKGVLGVAHVDTGLGDGLLQVRDGLGIQHGKRVACCYPVALRDG